MKNVQHGTEGPQHLTEGMFTVCMMSLLVQGHGSATLRISNEEQTQRVQCSKALQIKKKIKKCKYETLDINGLKQLN